jgi:uncharacterized protein YbjT (DUF2867 family)
MVLVAGATGGVGQIAVGKLIDAGFKVRALTRSTEKARSILGADTVEIVKLDLRDPTAVNASDVYKGCAGAIVAIGTTAFPSSRCADRFYGNHAIVAVSEYISWLAPRKLMYILVHVFWQLN